MTAATQSAADQAAHSQPGAPPRLGDWALAALPPGIARPAYDRRRLAVGIVHLGIGAFHRAHQAVYFDDLLRRRFGPYGILGVSLRQASVRDALHPQDGLYTLVVREGDRVDYRFIGAVKAVLVAPEDPEAVLRRLADPATRLVTLTVTEKGYGLGPDGALDPWHPDISHDLASPARPRSAVGMLAEALRRRRAAGTPPPTLLTCDNLPSNGRTLRRALVAFAALDDDGFAQWIERAVAVPCSMVDRIVPAATAADRAAVERALGVEDRGVVATEPFCQWVVEEAFAEGTPPLGEAGVELVADVAPYEHMKLRLLNGSHSSIAYLGQLAGYEHVSDAMADPALRRFLERMMAEEIAPALSHFSPERLARYTAELLRRFDNRAIRHRTWQIAMDGSQKLPQRLIGTIADRLAAGGGIERLTLAVAAWLRFLGGRDDEGRAIEISDPRAEELTRWAASAQPASTIVGNLLDRSGIFPAALASSAPFRNKLIESLSLLRRSGAKAALRLPAYGGP